MAERTLLAIQRLENSERVLKCANILNKTWPMPLVSLLDLLGTSRDMTLINPPMGCGNASLMSGHLRMGHPMMALHDVSENNNVSQKSGIPGFSRQWLPRLDKRLFGTAPPKTEENTKRRSFRTIVKGQKCQTQKAGGSAQASRLLKVICSHTFSRTHAGGGSGLRQGKGAALSLLFLFTAYQCQIV